MIEIKVDVPMLFHGTTGTLNGPAQVGGYDKVFWSARTSCIAQTYISAGSSQLAVVEHYELDELVRPNQNCVLHAIARTLCPAHDPQAQYDRLGQATSWCAFKLPDGSNLTKKHIVQELCRLGYGSDIDASGGFRALVKVSAFDSNTKLPKVQPKSYLPAGQLLIIEGFSDMRFASIATGDPDLTAIQYHRHEFFQAARSQGFDGVIIDDFCQTKTWGNVGHESIGFFEHALQRLTTQSIDATHFEWGPEIGALRQQDSPEFSAWRNAQAWPRERMR